LDKAETRIIAYVAIGQVAPLNFEVLDRRNDETTALIQIEWPVEQQRVEVGNIPPVD
jgi:hypothetical protein